MQQFKIGDWVRSTKYLHMAPCKVESIFESNERKGDFGLKAVEQFITLLRLNYGNQKRVSGVGFGMMVRKHF